MSAISPYPLEYGRLYKCRLEGCHEGTVICRYGYHRKNNPNNWSMPPEGMRPSCIWRGWRNNRTGKFYRPEQILSWEPHLTEGGTDER